MTSLYHCTSEHNLKRILSEGLNPQCSRSASKAIYLADDVHTALNYRFMHKDTTTPVLLKIELSDLDPSLLCPDDYELQDWLDNLSEEDRDEIWGVESASQLTWQKSLEYCNQVAYQGIIPGNCIQVVKL